MWAEITLNQLSEPSSALRLLRLAVDFIFFFHFFVLLAICDVSWCLYCFWLAHLFLQQSRSWLPSLWLQCRVVKWIIFFKSRLISDFPSFLKLSYFALQGRFYVHISVKQFLPESLNWEPNELQKVLAFFFIFCIIIYFSTVHPDPLITYAFCRNSILIPFWGFTQLLYA